MTPCHDDLIELARRGDRHALESLLAAHAAEVISHARARIGAQWAHQLSPEDILQATCLDAIRSIRAYEPRGEAAFSQWLRRLAEHNIIDAVRGLDAERRRIPRARPARFPSPSDPSAALLQSLTPALTRSASPSRRLSLEDSRSLLAQAMRLLPDDHRAVVEWYDLEGRPIAQIAAELHKSPGATYMMRTRALERLREVLEENLSGIFSDP